MKRPLAFRMRPTKLDQILGQDHLIKENQLLRNCVEKKQLFSMIFYGPPGTGKTTLAMVLAEELGLPYRLFNAVTGNKKELDLLFEEAKYSQPLIVIIDEVHRLNKDKQDLLLPYIEDGSIIMLGATTANPFFSINPAIRSRVQLLEIKPLTTSDIQIALQRAIEDPEGFNHEISISSEAKQLIAIQSGGDLRYALNLLEICAVGINQGEITVEIVRRYSPHANLSISKTNDGHYDAVSAFQKSIRGSDVQAALYYLARLIQAGDMDSIERRLLVIAYEDIGLGNPAAVARTLIAIDAAKRVGFPEGMIPLANAVIDLTLSPKSRSADEAIQAAMELVKKRVDQVPNYLRLTPVGLSEDEKYDYQRSDLWPYIQYLPETIKDAVFYKPQLSGSYEKQLAQNKKELDQIQRTSNLAYLKKK